MKNYKLYSIITLAITLLGLSSCADNMENFENKTYINSDPITKILIKPTVDNSEFTIETAIAKKEVEDITINYCIDTTLVNHFNEAYNEEAIILPKEHYSLSENKAEIKAGTVLSTPIKIIFDKINQLDRKTTFVLPVKIENSNISILESQRTKYFVFKGAALINVVADMENNNLHIDTWNNPSVVNNLSAITLESLIRARNYDRLISTVMGIEGYFLIRLGDAGFPSNQIQVATTRGNFPDGDSKKGLPTNEWVHVAVTYDNSTSELKIYVDGKLQSEGLKSLGTISLGKNGKDGFYIGRSYEDGRFLAGEFSECRIWNKALTAEEINQPNHFYQVDPNSEGLVAYWKCDEGGGNTVKDHTINGNDLTAKNPITWTPVSLPK